MREVDEALQREKAEKFWHEYGPTLIAAAATVGDPAGSALVFSSPDGGRTWRKHDPGLRPGGDVWVEVLPDGTALFSALAPAGEEGSAVHVFRSADGGGTWSWHALSRDRFDDRPWIDVSPDGVAHAIWNANPTAAMWAL